MGKRSEPNRRIVVVRGRRLDVCGLARPREQRRCRPRAAAPWSPRRPFSARLVALSSCLTFLAALALSGFAASRGPAGLLAGDPHGHLPAGASNHTVDEFFLAAGAR